VGKSLPFLSSQTISKHAQLKPNLKLIDVGLGDISNLLGDYPKGEGVRI